MNLLSRLLTKFAAIFDRTNNLLAWLGSALILFIMLSIGSDVILRYGFGKPQLWVIEITAYSLLFVTFLGTSWLLKREGHVKVDVLVNSLTPRVQALFGIISSVVGIIVCLPIIWYSAQVAVGFFQQDTRTPTVLLFPKAPLIAIICIGFFLLLLQFVRRANEYLRSWRALANKGHEGASQT